VVYLSCKKKKKQIGGCRRTRDGPATPEKTTSGAAKFSIHWPYLGDRSSKVGKRKVCEKLPTGGPPGTEGPWSTSTKAGQGKCGGTQIKR